MPRYSLIQQDYDDKDDVQNLPESAHYSPGIACQNNHKCMNSSAICSTGQSSYGLNMSSTISDLQSQWQQTYPPLSSYICADTLSSRALLSYHQPASDDDDQNDRARSLTSYFNIRCEPTGFAVGTDTLSNSMVINKSIKETIDLERKNLQQQHQEEHQGVGTLIKSLEQEASCILKEHRQKIEKQRREEEERLRREESKPQETEQNTKIQVAKSSIGQKNMTGVGIGDGKSQGQRGKAEAQLMQKKDKENESTHGGHNSETTLSQTPEHILKVKKLIAQLVKLRESIEPFGKNKAVSKRRLLMKKTIRGKLNTLSESAAKVQEVCAQVNTAINAARKEDAQIKEAIKQGQQGFTPDMACGKRYIVDLFASNIIQRVQAEGFNGPRGDGFPLAAMITLVSSENKDVTPVLAAHIYTVCRITIPSLPIANSNATEDEFMVDLGMLRDKNGDFESWDRFSSRTENIISIMANIQASMPPTHSVLGGHKGAAEWLKRFLESLPPPPTSPLPLLTAPVLYAFLCGAGCMLAHKHENLFKRSLRTISEDILNRLDQGEIGKPSFIRLSKTLEKGYDGFRSTLPPKAIPEMYNSTIDAATKESAGMYGNQISNTPFGGSGGGGNPSAGVLNSNSSEQRNPFGGTSFSSTSMTNINAISNPFGNDPSAASNPFLRNSSGNQKNQFGRSVQNSIAKTASSGFGTTGTFENTKKSNPFAVAEGVNTHTAFGVSSRSPFTANMPFGSSNQVQAKTTPFGSSNQVRNTSTPFGSSNLVQTKATPFGSSNQVQSSPFGTQTQANPSASTFASSRRATTGASPFGSTSGNNNKKNGPPCKFYQRGSCKYGKNCRYSHEGGGNTPGFSNQAGNSNRNASFRGGFNPNRRNPFA